MIKICIECVEDRWDVIKLHTTLSKKEFCEEIVFCLNSTYFTLKSEFFQQKFFGTAMDLPISSTEANIVIEFLEQFVFNFLDIKPLFVKGYIDNCILCLPVTDIQNILKQFNNFHNYSFLLRRAITIKLTSWTYPYIMKRTIKIKTRWYTKDAWSSRYLYFE